MPPDWKTCYASLHARGEATFPPAGLHYLLQLTRQAYRDRGGKPLLPREWTEEFRRRIRADFGRLGPAVLEHWELRRAEDLGQALLLLGQIGCLQLGAEDTVSAFAAEGTLWTEK